MRIMIWITTTKTRHNYIYWMLEQLKEMWFWDDDIRIFDDDWTYWLIKNKQRCFRETLRVAKEVNWMALILEDDILFCEKFKQELVMAINNSWTPIISLFTRQKHIINKAYLWIAEWCFKRWFYEQAILWRDNFDLYEKCWEYYESNLKFTMPIERQKHHDVILQDFMVENWIKWSITMPTLVEHIWVISSMKHQVWKSILFIDNIKK